jgi:cytochrome c-type biogenesis protein CcmH/NrfG
MDPNDAIAWYERGFILEKAGRYTDATASYSKAHAIDPDCSPDLFG